MEETASKTLGDFGSFPTTGGARPATSPANGFSPSRPKTSPCEGRVLHVPRNMAIRSRVLMQRTSAGLRRVPLPPELVPVVRHVQHDTAGEACTARSRCLHTTHFVGDKSQMVPVEMVSAEPVAKRPITSRLGSLPTPAEKEASRQDVPVLTPELRNDLKQKLDSLVSVCRTDFKAHPRSTRFFLRELWDLCQLLKVPISNRPYRRKLADGLYQFVMHIPNFLPADLAPSSSELSEDSFLTMTVMLALGSIPWEFKFNRVLYRLCNCASFGSARCLLPAGGIRSSEFAGTTSSRPSQQPRGDTAPVMSTALSNRLEALQRQEKHLPTRLLGVSAALRVRFLEFVQQAESTSLREKAESGFQDGSRDNELDYRGPRENPADSMPPIDDEEEDPFADVNVTAAIDKLLSLPFETAIVERKELQAYVHSSDRSKQEVLDLEAEFKESWSPEAPRELRDLLEELLFPVAKRKAEGLSKL